MRTAGGVSRKRDVRLVWSPRERLPRRVRARLHVCMERDPRSRGSRILAHALGVLRRHRAPPARGLLAIRVAARSTVQPAPPNMRAAREASISADEWSRHSWTVREGESSRGGADDSVHGDSCSHRAIARRRRSPTPPATPTPDPRRLRATPTAAPPSRTAARGHQLHLPASPRRVP